MSKATLAQAFEPFFTTKDVGHGTGLGLSQVYGFVKQSGGHVKIYSELGEGTTVKIYLPRLLDIEAVQEPIVPEHEAPKGDAAELLLVVEDDDDVRAYSVEVLRELGYRVLEATDGAAALRMLEREPATRLLFTDVGLPGGMNGRQLADAARRLQPRLQVLFTTGYARNAIVHSGRLDAGVHLITKPFTYEELAVKVRDVLDSAVAVPRVLIVEDEPLVSMMAADSLAEAGFAVEEAATAAEALIKMQARERFDAVILDMRLPDRMGDDLARHLRSMHPDLPIVIASGYDKVPLERMFIDDPRVVIVPKPYLGNDLRRALQRLGLR